MKDCLVINCESEYKNKFLAFCIGFGVREPEEFIKLDAKTIKDIAANLKLEIAQLSIQNDFIKEMKG